MSYLQSKKLAETSDANEQTRMDEQAERESAASRNLKSDKMHYPTNFRVREDVMPDAKNLKTCACRIGSEKTESTSENETSKEVLCRCTKIDVMKSNTECVEEKSSQFSEAEGGTCVRPTGVDKQRKGDQAGQASDVLVLSERDIKMRGGFRPLEGDTNYSQTWFEKDAECGRPRVGKKVLVNSKTCLSDTERDEFLSCESSSDTSLPKQTTQNSAIICATICSGDSQKPKPKSASAVTCYCSVENLEGTETSGRRSSTSASRATYDILCDISKGAVPSKERCTRCGKKRSSPNVQGAVAERCDVCGKKSKQNVKIATCGTCGKKKSKQSVRSESETPCGICGKPRLGEESEAGDGQDGSSAVCARPRQSQDSEPNEYMLSCRCSTDSLTCRDDPDAPCQTPEMRQDRIVELLDSLNDMERCTGPITEQRATMVQQLFREITMFLCQEPQQGEPAAENQMSVRSQKLAKNKKQAQLQCCMSKMDDYLEECFLKGYCRPANQLTNMELYRIELDPDFVYKEGTCPGDEDGRPGDDDALDGDCGCESDLANNANAGEEDCEPCKLLQQQLEQLNECDPCKLLQQQQTDEDKACEEYNPPCKNVCNCCHCRAQRCHGECKTVTTTLMIDPGTEMKYFIDAMIIDLHTMETVLHARDALPKPEKLSGRTNRALDSYPVKITDVNDLGMSSLYVQWEIYDCCGIAGYEIYVDGQLTNRYYSPGHQSGVICDVNINRMHQIVLRAQPIGEDFPGDSCKCTTVAKNGPSTSRGPGSLKPFVPSIYLYHPCLKAR